MPAKCEEIKSPHENETPVGNIEHIHMLESYLKSKEEGFDLSDEPLSEVEETAEKPPTV